MTEGVSSNIKPTYSSLSRGLIESFGCIGAHWFIFLVLTVFPFLAIWGTVAVSFGLPLHFRDDLTILNLSNQGGFFGATVNSPSFFTHAFTTFFAGLFWLTAAAMGDHHGRVFRTLSVAEEARYLAIRIAVTSVLMLVAAVFPLSRGVPPVSSLGELLRCVLGILAGLAVFATFAMLSRGLANRLKWPRAHILLVLLIALVVSLHFFPKLLTVVALFKLLAGVAAFYVLVNVFAENWRFWAFTGFVVVPLLIGSFDSYKYTFPGMEDLYSCPLQLEKDRLGGLAEKSLGRDCQNRNIAAPPARQSPGEALALFGQVERDRSSLKDRHLVVVATSGGGYRATFWTALVLDQLRHMSQNGEATDIARYIRLVTGASGGLIGGAYFASLSRDELADSDPERSLVKLISKDISTRANQQSTGPLARLNVPLPRDSLSDVAQQLAFWDSLQIFLPGLLPRCLVIFGEERCRGDRGRTLEKSWQRIGVQGDAPLTFELHARAVASGDAPSIIFSPMILETGQPLLISDLELKGIADPEGRSSWDFFATFPTTWRTFTLGTAGRMNSTFPYVAPGVDLPTTPPRRVVDAGYFDNYGLATALSYLRRSEVRKWIKENGLKGALIIQVSAFPALFDVTASPGGSASECEEMVPYEGFSVVRWLTGPLEALAAARERSMLFRNEDALNAVREIYVRDDLTLTRITFENASRSSYSWYLPEKHLECLKADLEKNANNVKAAERISRLWRNENADEGWDWPPLRD